jgi:hypothetical protein
MLRRSIVRCCADVANSVDSFRLAYQLISQAFGVLAMHAIQTYIECPL